MKKAAPLHRRLSSARQLLIDWRASVRTFKPEDYRDRPGMIGELERFDEAIKAVLEARNVVKPKRERA